METVKTVIQNYDNEIDPSLKSYNLEGIEVQYRDAIVILKCEIEDREQNKIYRQYEKLSGQIDLIRNDDKINLLVLVISKDQKTNFDRKGNYRVSIRNVPIYSFNDRVSAAISKLDIPVIAVADGGAVGIELEWILACDLRIVSEESCFGLPQIKIGEIPNEGGTQRLPRLIGRSRAMEMILTGDLIKSEEALKIGLVNKVVPSSELKKTVMELANSLLSKSSISLRFVKEAIYKGLDQDIDQGLRLEADLYFLMHTTHDRSEGIRAFQEKREARFKGR